MKTRTSILLVYFLLASTWALLDSSVSAQSARLFGDLNQTPNPVALDPTPATPQAYLGRESFVHLGKKILLSAKGASTGQELYLTDGSKAGTQLVKDIRPGARSSNPRNLILTQDGKKAFFVVDGRDKSKEEELWVSDGTAKGTLHLLTVARGYTPSLRPLAQASASSILFTYDDSKVGAEPWISNGTPAGTRLLLDVVPGTASSNPIEGIPLGKSGKTLFNCTQPLLGNELWITDGTAKGTQLLKDIQPGKASGYPSFFTTLGASKVLFVARDAKTGAELWSTDGTATGTTQVLDLDPGSANGVGWLHPLGSTGLVVFSGNNGKTGWEPFVTDGTAKGTQLLLDTVPGTGSGSFRNSTISSNGKLMYWIGRISHWQNKIFVTDGRPQGTKVFSPIPFTSDSMSLAELQGKIYFEGQSILPGTGYELSVTDGTKKGTQTLVDYRLGFESGYARHITRLDASTILFRSYRKQETIDLVRYRPGKGAQRVEIGVPNASRNQSGIGYYAVPYANKMAFIGDDGKHGEELWLTDGTWKGSQMVKDVDPGTWNGAKGPLAVLGDKVFFVGNTLLTGAELWASNGTASGTYLVKEIRPGTKDAGIHSMRSIGRLLYFTADDGVHGQEPWVSDGTNSGTRLLRDVVKGGFGSNPVDYAGYGNRVVFFGRNLRAGRDLYLTDGTSQGTKTLYPDLHGSANGRPWSSMAAMGGRVYFPAYSPTNGKDELWVTDFTRQGTFEVASLGDRWGSQPRNLNGGYGRILYTGFTTKTGYEFLTSDGTKAGTKVFLDLAPAKASSNPWWLTSIGSRHHYFIAYQNLQIGVEAWRTDGTIPGTISYDLSPGQADSNAGFVQPSHHFVPIGDKVLVAATHPVHGRELFVITNGATVQNVGSSYGGTWLEGTDPVLGQKAALRGGSGLANAVHVILHGIPTTRPRFFGRAGWWHMDITKYFGLTSVQTGKSFSLQIPIPSSPALKGIQLIHQSFSYDGTRFPQSLELSNGLLWTLGN